MPPTQRTIVYVDGFNLYYGALKDTPHRWLDLGRLCTAMLRQHQQIVGVKYFTARVQPRAGNPQQAQRQQIYLRALETVPNLSIYYGRFFTNAVFRRLVKTPKRGSPSRQVWVTEEKGSDVNLASHLLIDGFRARYDLAVVISNDSDLKTPIEVVRQDLNAPVGVLNPPQETELGLVSTEPSRGAFLQADPPRGAGELPVRRQPHRRLGQILQAPELVGAPEMARAARRRLRIPAAEANRGNMAEV